MEAQQQITLNTKLMKMSDKQPHKSHDHFKETRIESCAFVKKKGNTMQAVPFYAKTKLSCADKSEKSTHLKSMACESFSVKPDMHIGMDTKPLSAYNPESYRNRLPVTDANIPSRNGSQVVLGDRGQRDTKHYVSVSKNTYGNFGKVDPVSNPGILSERTMYHHKQQDK